MCCQAIASASLKAAHCTFYATNRRSKSNKFVCIQAVVQILAPLAGPRVAEALRKTVNEMFGVYTQALAAGFAKYTRPDGTLPPRLGASHWPSGFVIMSSLSPMCQLWHPVTQCCD